MKNQLNLLYALRDNSIVSISDVESGLKCGCVCPACGERLVAKKGKIMMHHFAHYSGENCAYGYESSLHLAAKDIISKAHKMTIPPVYVSFPNSHKKDELINEAEMIKVEKVELEKRYGSIIPDIVVYTDETILFVEIFVTHRIDDEKLEKLHKARISTIEIDLSKKSSMISIDELTSILLNDSAEKQWKYNSLSEQYYQQFIKASDEKEVVHRGYAMHVDGCPISKRIWKGKPYANFVDDCLNCQYCISNGDTILCSGRSRIATIDDFFIPEADRIRTTDLEQEKEKADTIAQGTCPYCGSKLIERQGKYGLFLGCSNYPHCRFTASL